MRRIQVTIITANKDNNKTHMNVIETDSLLSYVRIIRTFKPKRGYRIVKTMMEEVEVLV